ncbi:MAG: hypothetical protein IPH12_13900 [Saprospirales bacterium]|nr:hypothetical protein [Saprospirales bacterium]
MAALHAGPERYLLYNYEFFYPLASRKNISYGVLAHAIGHLLESGFSGEAQHRSREESMADAFMGRALQALGVPLEGALAVADFPGYSYPIDPQTRKKHIQAGWERANAFLEGQTQAGFNAHAERIRTQLLPSFQWPPPECAAHKVLPATLFPAGKTLASVDTRLCRALDARGYAQRSYFQVPNGFALVTQLEQCDQAWKPRKGDDRWKDYPAPERFDDFWDYLESLVLPKSFNFRLFVFVVTDASITLSQDAPVSKEQALAWLQRGGLSLPPALGNQPFGANHKVTVLIYEFEGKGADFKGQKRCPCLKNATEHLNLSGLTTELNKRQ